MTVSDSITLPEKSVQFCAVTGDFEVQVNGQIIGYAATELRGTQMANEYVYAVLSAGGQSAADVTQDDADALFGLHLVDAPAPLVQLADRDPAGVLLGLNARPPETWQRTHELYYTCKNNDIRGRLVSLVETISLSSKTIHAALEARMSFHFLDLDERTRTLMVLEFEDDLTRHRVYVSDRLNPEGQRHYPDLLRQALTTHTPEWLAAQLRAGQLFNHSERRRTPSGGITSAQIPSTAADTLAEGEFNRYYMRAICRRALEDGISQVQVYRAKAVQHARSASQAKIGHLMAPDRLLDDLRTHPGTDTALGLPPGPNSGLSVRLPVAQTPS
jgi:hypothetical protein